jgi:hypothetical protein
MNSKSKLNDIVDRLASCGTEMECLYSIERLLKISYKNYFDVFIDILKELPSGFEHHQSVNSKILFEDKTYRLKNFPETPWFISCPINIQNETLGSITVFYKMEFPEADHGPFLHSELRMLQTVADRLGHYILQYKLREYHGESSQNEQTESVIAQGGWKVVLGIIRKTEPNLYIRLLRKILHQLIWDGVPGAEKLLQLSSIDLKPSGTKTTVDENSCEKK